MTVDTLNAAWFLVDISWRALAAAAAVALLLRLLRIRAAGVLHSAWSAVLFTMLFMPVLASIVPALPVPAAVSADGLLGGVVGTAESASAYGRHPPQRVSVTNTLSSAFADSARSVDRLPGSVSPARPSRPWFPTVLLGVYAVGVLMYVARLLYGSSLASAMIRRAKRGDLIHVDVTARVYASPEVIVPMTVGAIRPVIVLPVTWRAWDSDTLAAILAHEAAHVRRHDALIQFAAHLNRAIFWFHPLAWWLERKLAVTAEHACDEAAARAIGEPHRYAEILVEMANLVSRHHGRLAWQAVGVNGAGLLDSRIDRLLCEDAFARASRGKKVAVAIGCIALLAMVIACRQQPLRENPELARRLADQSEQAKRFEAARDLTPVQADALEQRIAANPDDFDARWQLVTYYRTSTRVAWDKKVPGLRRHALWLIEHYPEHEVAAPALSPRYDPEGFAAAKKLWEAQLARPDASPFLVYRAAMFFAPHDRPYAEQLILRGMAMDPDSSGLKARMPPSTGGYEWPNQLSSLYAAAIRGTEGAWRTDSNLRFLLDEVNSPFAKEVRGKLEVTSDAKLLARVGGILTRPNPSTNDPAVKRVLEDARALGNRYLERALKIDPTLDVAKAAFVRMRLQEQTTDADRLASRSFEHYLIAEDITEYAKQDFTAGKEQRDKAEAEAEEVLKMAAAHAQDPAYSAAVMTAHHVLAMAALRAGDRQRAVYHMGESVNVPASERIQYAPTFSWIRPVNRLLKAGERERVVEFLEALAGLTISGRDGLLKDAQAVRDGRMPSSYQFMLAREGR